MRRPEDYTALGRNDPLSPDQLREHPYDFVALPEQPKTVQAVGHDRWPAERLDGKLRLVYVTRAPLHVGSGVFETAKECGLGESSTVVRGVVRRGGSPILPGASWKGAVRARYEAITGSRLGLVDTRHNVPSFKVPEALKQGEARKYQVRIEDPRVRALAPPRNVGKSNLDALSPAEALFGAMGYRGRLHPGDGEIEAPRPDGPLRVAPLDSPVPHRLARPGKARPGQAQSRGRGEIVISEVEGRKFYYDGPIVAERADERLAGPAFEWIDQVPEGAVITVEVGLECLTEAELGALLVSAGWGEAVGIVRFGGYKSVGLGRVELRSVSVTAASDERHRRWRPDAGAAIDPAAAVATATDEGLIDRDALAELHAVTTRQRPGAP